MILSLVYFLPCLVSLLWLVSFSFKLKTHRQTQYMVALLFSTVFYAIYGIYIFPDVDYEAMVRLEPVCIPAGLLFPVYLISCLYIHRTGRELSPRTTFALLLPPIAVGAIVNILYYIIGFDTAAQVSRAFATPQGLSALPPELNNALTQTYCFCTYNLFVGLGAVAILLTMREIVLIQRSDGYAAGDVLRFFFSGKPTTQSRAFAFLVMAEVVLMGFLIVLGSTFMRHHVGAGVVLTILVAVAKHCASHVEFYGKKDTEVSLYGLSHLMVGIDTVHQQEQASDTDDQPLPTADGKPQNTADDQPETALPATAEHDLPISAEPATAPERSRKAHKIDVVAERFVKLMEEDKLFQQEDLTAEKLCEIMGVGRTTLSTALNSHFDQPLRDIINHYRIEEAKRYMTAHPTATQEEVAAQCGFRNAQYLNLKFKSIVGQTPAMWLAEQGIK